MFFSQKKEIDTPQIDTPQINIDKYGSTKPDEDYIITSEISDKPTKTVFDTETNEFNIISKDEGKDEEGLPTVEVACNTDEVEDEYGNEDEDGNEYGNDDDEDDEDDEETESTIYVITIDDKPSFYETDLDSAIEKIDTLSKSYNLNDYGYHTTLTNYKSDREIDIIRNFDFGFFSMSFKFHTIKIYRLDD